MKRSETCDCAWVRFRAAGNRASVRVRQARVTGESRYSTKHSRWWTTQLDDGDKQILLMTAENRGTVWGFDGGEESVASSARARGSKYRGVRRSPESSGKFVACLLHGHQREYLLTEAGEKRTFETCLLHTFIKWARRGRVDGPRQRSGHGHVAAASAGVLRRPVPPLEGAAGDVGLRAVALGEGRRVGERLERGARLAARRADVVVRPNLHLLSLGEAGVAPRLAVALS